MIESITFVWEYMRDEEKERIISTKEKKHIFSEQKQTNEFCNIFFVYLWFAQTNFQFNFLTYRYIESKCNVSLMFFSFLFPQIWSDVYLLFYWTENS